MLMEAILSKMNEKYIGMSSYQKLRQEFKTELALILIRMQQGELTPGSSMREIMKLMDDLVIEQIDGATHCQKEIEGGGICCVRLDCHLHDRAEIDQYKTKGL